jgi:hypothetical protein
MAREKRLEAARRVGEGACSSPCFCHTLVAFHACLQQASSRIREGVVRMPTLSRNKTRSPVEDVLFSARDRGPPHSFDNGLSPLLVGEERRTDPGASKFEIPVEELRRLANNHASPIRPSIGRRLLRTFFSFLIAVSVGVAATVAWQHHGDEANKMVRNWTVASLGWLSSLLTAQRLPPDLDTTAEKTASTVSGQAANDAPAPFLQTTPEMATGLVQKLESIAENLAALKQSVAELTAKQEQMALKIENLRAADQQIRGKTPPPRKRIPTASRRPSAESVAPQPLPAPPPSSLPPPAIPRPPSVISEDQR